MKTAISLSDELFRLADALAGRLGVSRSQLYATALAEYLAKHEASKVTERLDAVYRTESSQLDPRLGVAQARSIRQDEW